MMSNLRHWPAAAAVAIGVGRVAWAGGPTTAPATRAAPPNVAYALWAHFKPGSSATLAGDVDLGGTGKVHLAITLTLKAVTADAVTVVAVQQMTAMGQSRDLPPQTQTIRAADPLRSHLSGTQDVQAMGRTFACQVYETALAAAAASPTVKLYANPDVPGGSVRLEGPGPGGTVSGLTLTAMSVK